MQAPSALYSATIFMAIGVLLVVSFYAWRRRDTPGAAAFAVLLLDVVLWLFFSGAHALSSSADARDVWHQIRFLNIATIPVFFLAFVLHYGGQEKWLPPPRLLALLSVPLITQVVLWTNSWHGLWLRPFTSDSSIDTFGPWFWVHTIYSYLLLMLGVVLVVRVAVRSFSLYRVQSLALLVGTAVPLAMNLLITFNRDYRLNDLMPFGFATAGIIFAWAVFRHRFLDLAPVARNTVIDRMRDGMLVVDAHGRVADLNPSMQELLAAALRQPSQGLRGRTIGLPVAQLLDLWPQLAGRLESETPVQLEIGFPLEEGNCYYDVQLGPLLDRRGRMTGRLLVWHDITDRKEAEQSLRQYTAELEASNAELDAFAHTVAHDLKTPLTSLIGFGQLLEKRYERLEPAQLQTRLHSIVLSGQKMTRIIDELLLLARVRKMDEIEVGLVDMAAIVREVLARFEAEIAQAQAEVVVVESWPAAQGYAPWVEEVWVNYLSNALKYGGVPPRVELGAREGGDGQVCFWVRDNGSGLSPEQQKRLFAEFSRLEQARAQGYGLGLSIVRRIVEKLGGQVGVESEEGQGCLFYFTLPAGGGPRYV